MPSPAILCLPPEDQATRGEIASATDDDSSADPGLARRCADHRQLLAAQQNDLPGPSASEVDPSTDRQVRSAQCPGKEAMGSLLERSLVAGDGAPSRDRATMRPTLDDRSARDGWGGRPVGPLRVSAGLMTPGNIDHVEGRSASTRQAFSTQSDSKDASGPIWPGRHRPLVAGEKSLSLISIMGQRTVVEVSSFENSGDMVIRTKAFVKRLRRASNNCLTRIPLDPDKGRGPSRCDEAIVRTHGRVGPTPVRWPSCRA